MAKTPNADIDREAQIKALHDMHALKSPSELLELCEVPMDIAVALSTGRASLMKLAKPRAMSADEVAILYKLITVLIDTNLALKNHANEVAHMAQLHRGNLQGLINYSMKLESFANFDHYETEDC